MLDIAENYDNSISKLIRYINQNLFEKSFADFKINNNVDELFLDLKYIIINTIKKIENK